METRKIQEVGGGTYTVSLPKEWADAQAVEAGSVVNVHTHIDDLLVVQPRDRAEETDRRVLVRVEGDGTARLERTLRAAYAAGAAEIRFTAAETFTRDQRRRVRRAAGTLVGVTLDEESESRLVIRTMLDPEEVSVWQSVRQLQFVALSMHREATAALVGEATVEGVRSRDDEADRLFAMVDRHFGRGLDRLDEVDALGVTRSELFDVRTVAHELERVADHADRIAAAATDIDALDAAVAEDIRAVGETARGVVEAASRSVVDDGPVATAYDALDARDSAVEDVTALETRLFDGGTDRPELVRAVDSLRRTAELGGNVAELRLRMAARDGALGDPSELEAGGTARADGE